jgi:hydroxymethylglutaryl-CoA lyase
VLLIGETECERLVTDVETCDKIKHSAPVDTWVFLQEVGPRDGLQNEPIILPAGIRASLIDRLAAAGLARIQIGSFVSTRRVPQMAETDQVWRSIQRDPAKRYSVLVLNRRGLDKALAAGIPHVEIYVSASETHSLRNSGMTVQAALKEAEAMVHTALQSNVGVTAGVMCAFGCFYEGAIDLSVVSHMVRCFDALGPVEIGLADTAGLADPSLIRQEIEEICRIVPMDRMTLHLHDTRGFGLENVRTALKLGVRRFDSSVGGLGGCPFIPGAAGNISTEDTVAVVESMGFETHVDVTKIAEVRADLARLLGRELPGKAIDQGGTLVQKGFPPGPPSQNS